jgi:hypothetical protein
LPLPGLVEVATSNSIFFPNANQINIKEYKEFYKNYQKQTVIELIMLWDETVEVNEWKTYYDKYVWNNDPRRKERVFKSFLPKICESEIYSKIIQNYNLLEEEVHQELLKFAEHFPDFDHRNCVVFAVLSCGIFDGKQEEGELMLSFGMDMIEIYHSFKPILYPHELFHLYQDTIVN